jgi:hypothetical protein
MFFFFDFVVNLGSLLGRVDKLLMSWSGDWLFIGYGRGRLAMMSLREERVVKDFGRVVRFGLDL